MVWTKIFSLLILFGSIQAQNGKNYSPQQIGQILATLIKELGNGNTQVQLPISTEKQDNLDGDTHETGKEDYDLNLDTSKFFWDFFLVF